MTSGRFSAALAVTCLASALAAGSLACSSSSTDGDAVPHLTSLSVSASESSDASPSLTLVPAFSSDVYDYYVRCAPGKNAVTLTMTASPGSSSLVAQPPPPSASLPQQTVSFSVNENQAVVAVATDGKATTEYWIRCLPSDFPPLEWTPHPEAGTPPAGYYLVGGLFSTPTAAGYAMVLDGNGVPVWYTRAPAGFGASTVDSPAKNTVFYDPFYAPKPQPFQMRQLGPPGTTPETTEVAPNGYETDEHELRVLPNGDYLVLSFPYKYGVDLTGLNFPLPDGGVEPLGPNSILQDCTIVEFTPAGTPVWTWSASDHFDPVADSTHPITNVGPPPPDGGTAYDVYHCNSLDVDPSNGNILVSAREMDSVFYVDRLSKKVLWKMGGPRATLDDATYVSVPDAFHQQHDARLLPGWSADCNGGTGQVSVFDDESYGKGPSRGVLYDVVVGSGDGGTKGCNRKTSLDGGIPGKASWAWEYKGTSGSAGVGSFRISSDGSRVIGWGLGGNVNQGVNGVFTEVDVDGRDLIDFAFGRSGTPSYRAIKVPLSEFDRTTLRNTAWLP